MKCCDINTPSLKKLHTQYLGLRDTPNFSIDFISEYYYTKLLILNK